MKLKGKKKAAFLRRMAKGRAKAAGVQTSAKPRKKKRKSKSGGHVVARKRKHTKHRKSTKRRRSHGIAGGLERYIPPTDTLVGVGTAFVYGKLETAAQADQKHFIRSVPALVPQIGRAGNAGALLWLAGVVTRHPIVKNVAKGVLHVAAYQNGRSAANAFTKDAQDFKMGAPRPGRGRDELLVEEYLRRRGG